MENDYILNISIIDAIDWWEIIKYLLLLVFEIVACVYLLSRIDKERQRMLRLRAMALMLGLFVLGLFLHTPGLYCLWFIVVVAMTGVFANTKLGFADDEIVSEPPVKISHTFRNLVVWLALAVLAFSLGVGSNFISTIVRGPEVANKEVWFVSPEKDGGLWLGFKENDWVFDIHVSEEYTSYLSEGDCLELTYYELYPSLENYERYATKIQRSEGCE